MLKGDIGLRSIFAIVLSLMALSLLISVSSVGSLGGALQEGFDQVGTFTDYTTEVDDKETISDLAMFVRDRAVSCNQVEERNNGNAISNRLSNNPNTDSPRAIRNGQPDGYPGLSEVDHLGQNPSCFGGDASVIRTGPQLPVVGGDTQDNYMPGIYSREKFEVTERVTLEDNRPPTRNGEENYLENDVWLENNIAAVSANSFRAQIDQSASEHISTYRNYVVFFEESDVGEDRTNQLLEEWEENGDTPFSNKVWASENQPFIWSAPGDDNIRYHATTLALCPGDKGYIQMNRGDPDNSGVVDSQNAQKFPRIVITEAGESCVEGDLDSPEPYEGSVNAPLLQIVGDDGNLPNAEEFNLESQRRFMGPNTEPSSNRCQISYKHLNPLRADHELIREYDQGRVVDKQQTDFSFSYSRENQIPDNFLSGGFGLMNSLNLNGALFGPPEDSGDLRPQNANNAQNNLYGDLLCAENSTGQAEWHLCHSGVDSKDQASIGPFSYSCSGDDWSIDQAGSVEVTDDWEYVEPSPDIIADNGDGSYSISFDETGDQIGEVSWSNALIPGWGSVSTTVTLNSIEGDQGSLSLGESGVGSPTSVYFYETGQTDGGVISLSQGGNSETLGEWNPGETYTVTLSKQRGSINIIKEGGSTEITREGLDLTLRNLAIGEFNNHPADSGMEATVEEIQVQP